ncbi:MAG: aldehyde dehydrogenase [Proteobacteria bacterium]|nr:aldehyde dehydrogenase [Pseudomonadota bacterium]
MRYAETGINLEIDLTRGNIEKVTSDPKDTELYLGGLGTNAKIFWERVPPEVKAYDPENILMFSAGLLCSTPAQGFTRSVVTTISPANDLMAFSMMGGFFATEMKYAGYDKIILSGKSKKLVYILIHNDKIEIRDASHLKGKGSFETAELLRKELDEPEAQISSIGMAGENKVRFASIEQGKSSASRGGVGAVMGDKGVKAVVVRGTKDITVADPARYMKLVYEVKDYIKFRDKNPIPHVEPIMAILGTPQEMKIHDEKWHTQNFVWGNARVRRRDYWTDEIAKEWHDTLEKARTRQISCYGCTMECAATISMPGLPTYMMKCFSKLTYTMGAYSTLDFGLRIAQQATEHGLDAFSAPQVMAFALELLDDEILTDEDFPGMPTDNEGRFYWLLDKIVKREGIGDILADGTHRAAEKIGKGAEKYAHNNIKKLEQLPLKLGMLNPVYYLMYCTGEKVSITQIEGQFPQGPFLKKEDREEFVKDWFQVPDEKFKKYFVDWEPRGENSNPHYPTAQMSSEIVDWMEKMHYIDDALGLCTGLSSFHLKPPYHIHNIPHFIEAGAGIKMDEEKLTKTVKRYRTLVRANNIRRGMRRRDEIPPEDHWKKRFPELEKELLDTYYEFKGWNDDGIPTVETLEELGLGYVADDFIKRGILTEIEDNSAKKASA